MADEITTVEKETPKVQRTFAETLGVIFQPENIQKYGLGTKKNGEPRAVYDIIKDMMYPKEKEKKKKKSKPDKFSFYFNSGSGSKKKKKKDKYWSYD